MCNEIWKPIVGAPFYEVSNLGRVRSFKTGQSRLLKPRLFLKSDYLRATLYINKQKLCFLVHRLVAEAFIPNPDSKPCVNHINGIKTDNRAENLEWCTYSENTQHSYKIGLQKPIAGENRSDSKFTHKQILFIRENPRDLNTCELAKMFGVQRTTISLIQTGKTYKSASGQKRAPLRPRVSDEIRNEIRRLYVKGDKEFGAMALAKRFGIDSKTVRRFVKKD